MNWFFEVKKFLDRDVLTAVLNGRLEDGVGSSGCKPTAQNFRLELLKINFVHDKAPFLISSCFRFVAYRLIFFHIHGKGSKGKQPRTLLPNCLGRI